MIIYKDIITGAELMSDSHGLKEVDGMVYEIEGRMVNKGGESFDIGANPSAEEAEEGVEDSVEKVIDVVDNFRLTEMQMDRKSYAKHLQGYAKEVEAELKQAVAAGKAKQEDVDKFTSSWKAQAAKVCGKKASDFDGVWQTFAGENWVSESTGKPREGMLVLLNYREDGTTPYVTLWKHGLTEEKV